MNKYLLILLLILLTFNSLAQESEKTMRLTMNEAIQLAKLQSLSSFRSQNMYLSSYWQFRSYKARMLPSLNLSTSPFTYNASNREVPDDDGNNVFKYNRSISSAAGLSINQNIKMTGGTLSLASRYNSNYYPDLQTDKETYSINPIEIEYRQPLSGYNKFKWESKLEPLAFEKAKRSFIQEMESLSEKAINVFFGTVNAEIGLKIAEANVANADTLYNVGKGRFQIGTVTQDELLDLELSLLNAQMAHTKAQINLKQALNNLNSFLSFDKDVKIIPIIPDEIPSLKIDADKALVLAKENSPEILGFEEQLIQAHRSVAERKANSGLTANLNANLGYSKNANDISDAYKGPYNDNRGIGVTLNVPIMDWGNRRGQIQMARSNQQVTEATVKQSMIDFEQNILMKVVEFNLQEKQVAIAAKADTIAQKGYKVTKQRFMIGKVDVLKLNSAQTSLDNSKRSYISAIQSYWQAFYNLRKMTLYDFDKSQALTEDFDRLLQQ